MIGLNESFALHMTMTHPIPLLVVQAQSSKNVWSKTLSFYNFFDYSIVIMGVGGFELMFPFEIILPSLKKSKRKGKNGMDHK